MARIMNKDNAARFNKVVCEMQKVVKEYPEIAMAATDGKEGFKDGVGYLFIPECMIVPKPLMHSLHTLTFASDQTELSAGMQHRFVFIVRDVYEDGNPLPGDDEE